MQYLLAMVPAEYLINQIGYWESAIIAAKRASVPVGLFISKWDRVNDSAHSFLQQKVKLYEGIAESIFCGSNPETNAEILKAVEGKTAVVVGERSCGKTTLIYRLTGKPQQRIQNTHTTNLYAVEKDTFLIDTPGFRDFAVQDITEQERNTVFPEIAVFAAECLFHNCTHTHEDGCQVIEGVRSQLVSRERYQLYQKMTGMSSDIPKRKQDPDYRHNACMESFVCKVCGKPAAPEGAGSRHRNHCPNCLSSIHVDDSPGDRASLCEGIMDPVGVWVRKDGEWAIIHRCRLCGTFSSNRVAADDNPIKLMSIAVKPLASPPFPLEQLDNITAVNGETES